MKVDGPGTLDAWSTTAETEVRVEKTFGVEPCEDFGVSIPVTLAGGPFPDLTFTVSTPESDAPEVTSVDIYYNAGHPGVEEPHVHVVLWHVADESKVAK